MNQMEEVIFPFKKEEGSPLSGWSSGLGIPQVRDPKNLFRNQWEATL
jgi:hypothetical protein